MKKNDAEYQAISASDLSGLEARLADAAKLELALELEDITLIQNIVASYFHLHQQIQEQGATITKLRTMCGFEPKTERSGNQGIGCNKTDNSDSPDGDAQSVTSDEPEVVTDDISQTETPPETHAANDTDGNTRDDDDASRSDTPPLTLQHASDPD